MSSSEGGSCRPFGSFERLAALRCLRPRRAEGVVSLIAILSFLGIALGVAALIVVMAVMNGFRDELLTRILGVNGHVAALHVDGLPIENPERVASAFEAIEGVVRAAPYVEGHVMVSSNGVTGGALLRGLDVDDVISALGVSESDVVGSFDVLRDSDSDVASAAVGKGFARRYGLAVGDYFLIGTPSGPSTPFGVLPRLREHRVGAIFDIGLSEYDSVLIFLERVAASDFLSFGEGEAGAIEIVLDDPERTREAIPSLQSAGGESLRFRTWQEVNSAFFDALEVERNVMFLILSLIVLVAALNIVSGLVMLVKDKSGDIAALRAMGATRGSVMRIFLMTGGSIGAFGSATGTVLGVATCLNIEEIRQFLEAMSGSSLFPSEFYYLSRLPAKMDTFETVAASVMAMGLTFLASVYPSYRAARTDPSKALRSA